MWNAAEAVAKGAAWLDVHEPGWATKIDLAKLRLLSPCNCILGQLHGLFSNGLDACTPAVLQENFSPPPCMHAWSVDNGFSLWESTDPKWRELDLHWFQEVCLRTK